MRLSRKSPAAWIVASCLLLVVGLVIFWVVHSRRKPAPPPAPAVVQTMTVAPRTVPQIIDTLGTVLSTATVQVFPQTNGILTSVRINDGEVVHKGQLLFTIDPRPLADAVRQARGNLGRDQALEVDAADSERRLRLLNTEDSVAAKTYATARNTLNSLRATVAADRGALGQATDSLAYTSVRAPISGRAGAVLVKKGNLASTASTTPLVVVNTISPIDVSFGLPQSQVVDVREALSRQHHPTLPVIILDAVSGKEIERGAIAFQDNAYDQSSGTLVFRGRFANSSRVLSPGQFVTVRVLLSSGEGVIAVPETALQQGQQGPYVYALEGRRAVIRPLAVARLVDGQAVITKGLRLGDQVILTVPNDLRAGSEVQSASQPEARRATTSPQAK